MRGYSDESWTSWKDCKASLISTYVPLILPQSMVELAFVAWLNTSHVRFENLSILPGYPTS